MFESEQAAAEALASANSGETPVATEQAAPPAEQTTTPQVDAGTNHSESFTTIDIQSLPAELQGLAKQLQGDYTRKTQEAAPWRKMGQEFELEPDAAREALTFVQSLSDPDNQRALYEHLSEHFAAGEEDGDYEGSVDPREQEIRTLSDRLSAFERENMMSKVSADLDRQERTIRQENPDYSDEDISRIEQLAFAHQGSLLKAAEAYAAWRQSVIGGYVNTKGSTAATPGSPAGSMHAETPQDFGDDLDAAHKAALIKFAQELSN